MFLLALLLALPGSAEGNDALGMYQIEFGIADRMQAGILDPILGKGKASAFVSLEIDLKNSVRQSERGGEGNTVKYAVRPAKWDRKENPLTANLPDLDLSDPPDSPDEGKSGSGNKGKSATSTTSQQRQTARQSTTDREEAVTSTRIFRKFRVAVIHDSSLSAGKINSVRMALTTAFPDLHQEFVTFHSFEYERGK